MYKKTVQTVLILALSMVFLWFFFRCLLPVCLPFLLGTALALLAEPAVNWLFQKCRLKRTAATAIGVSAVFLLIATLLTLLSSVLLRQLGQLEGFWPQLETGLTQAVEGLRQWLQALAPRMPAGIHRLLDRLTQDLLSDGSALLSNLAARLPQVATGLLGNLSEGLFGLITGILSGYMLSARLPRLRQWLKSKLPPQWTETCLTAVQGLKKTLGGWLMAELKLALVAFGLLLIGLWLLRIRHSLTLAALITLVDAFPILGVGTVLLPWGILCLARSDRLLGFGLLGLYGVIWLTRSVLEPRLLGKGLGLDPLVTLLCIYGGFRLWGLGGMLLVPILAMIFSQMLRKFRR